ncbi:MAG TPA: hypothetical protein DDZ67_11690, partial [Xanthomonadaceae bacterium]|nr:hypothetical protein [Xanthomonadaceae bacterium]
MSSKSRSSIRAGLALVVVAGVLTACSSATIVRSPASAPDKPTPKTSVARPGATVTVQRGDTLYAISRRTNVTPQDLAAWNGLSGSATIYPGQTLRLYPGNAAPAAR